MSSTSARRKAARLKAAQETTSTERECILCHLKSGDPDVIADLSEGGALPPYCRCVEFGPCFGRAWNARPNATPQPEAEAAAEEPAEVAT